jgi:hypothetical protein
MLIEGITITKGHTLPPKPIPAIPPPPSGAGSGGSKGSVAKANPSTKPQTKKTTTLKPKKAVPLRRHTPTSIHLNTAATRALGLDYPTPHPSKKDTPPKIVCIAEEANSAPPGTKASLTFQPPKTQAEFDKLPATSHKQHSCGSGRRPATTHPSLPTICTTQEL